MPADISATAFNDASVKTRYRQLLDKIITTDNLINSSVKYISLGNEVDTYLSTHTSEYAQYKELIEDARTYLKTLKPNILVGVTTTFEGYSSTQKTNVATLNANMDVIILTYYPIDGSTFVPRDPTTALTDMQVMIANAGGKQIILQEFGYPSSSTTINSSTTKQSDFIRESFSAWRTIGTDKIPFISFFKYRDWNDSHVNTITGQVAGHKFWEFMRSLGLKNNDGTSKTAYTTFTQQIQ